MRPTRVRDLVLAGLCAVAAIVYVQRQCMANAATFLRMELSISVKVLGWLLSSWLWTYALFQIPGGRLGDRWGSRRALPLYCAVWSVATMLTGFVTWVPLLFLVRLVFGAAHAGLFPCVAIIIRQWMPVSRRGLATGLVAAFQQVGAGVASIVAGWWLGVSLGLSQPEWAAAEKVVIPELPTWIASTSDATRETLTRLFDWRWVFFWAAAPGLVWSAWFYYWFRDRPSEHASTNEAERRLLPAEPSGSETARLEAVVEVAPGNVFRDMVHSPTMWLICGQQFCRAFGYIFFQSWFPTYLETARHVSIQRSGWFTALMFFAALLGALCGGILSDWLLARTGSRRIARQGLAVASLLAAAAFAGTAYFVESANLAVAVLACGSFFASVAGPSGYTVTIEVAGRHTATVFGTMNMAGNIGAATFPAVVPFLLLLPEWLKLGISGWDLVLFVFAGVYLVAALLWMKLDPNRTIGENRQS